MEAVLAKRATSSQNGTGRKRGRPRKSDPAQATITGTGPAPTEKKAIFAEHWRKILTAKSELDKATTARTQANGVYRAALKSAKSAGLDPDAIRFALAINAREPDEVTLEFTNINSYLRWANIPVGTQLGLFEDGETVATKVDNDKLAEQNGEAFEEGRPMTSEASLADAKTKGFEAGSDGKFPSENPYEEGSPENLAWESERMRAQNKLAAKFGGPTAGAKAEAGATA